MLKRYFQHRAVVVTSGAAVLLALAIGLTACAPSPEPTSRFTAWEGVVEEFNSTIADFPSHYSFPPDVDPTPSLEDLVERPASDRELHERGTGLGYAYIYWECSWMRLALMSPPGALRDEALSMLRGGLDSEFRENYYIDEGQLWERQVIGGAELGDLSMMNAFYDADCRGLLE